MRQPLRRLMRLLLCQAAAVAAVATYLVAGGPLTPDGGLRQHGAFTLHEQVPGLRATGRPALVVMGGSTIVATGGECAAQVFTASDRRRTDRGLADNVNLVVYLPDLAHEREYLPGAALFKDTDGALARRLGLPAAASGCHPGYVLLDPAGFVRYRTYDPAWGEHAAEQTQLLEALR